MFFNLFKKKKVKTAGQVKEEARQKRVAERLAASQELMNKAAEQEAEINTVRNKRDGEGSRWW